MQPVEPSDILLAAFNARYAHCAFGARCLLANLGDLQLKAGLMEFDLAVQPRSAVEKMLARNPRIVGIGCYIWNIELVTKVAALLKKLRPEITLVLGGPEISYETEEQEIYSYADYVICGEGEIEFRKLCGQILDHKDTKNSKPATIIDLGVPSCSSSLRGKILHAEPVDVSQIELPYDLYTDEDIAHRAVYVEASRGCPFRCEYCMSSLDAAVRYFPKAHFLAAMQKLLDRGARTFRFVDRSFNIDLDFALEIIAFFRDRYQPGLMVHLEMIPDRLPDSLMDALNHCLPGMFQFEIGIQTFNPEVAHRIQRPLNIAQIETNLRRLRQEAAVHIHADLIAGLPGEDLDSFETGFNRLLALNPHEIQLGILKRLRGAAIDRHTQEWNMVYSPHAPYEILQTAQIDFTQMQRLQRFARYWNLTVNNGHFIQTAPLIWQTVVQQASRLHKEAAEQAAAQGTVPQASRLHQEAAEPAATQESVPQASRLHLPVETTGFDPHKEIHQTQRKNDPHWTQEGGTYFVTFRLADSIPQSRIKEYEELRRKWQEHHHPPYTKQDRERFNELFCERIDEWLDEGAGSCCLRDPALSSIVAETLQHFDGERYKLGEWVVMPNHVHLIVQPLDDHQLPDMLHSWKSYSANQINRVLKRSGRLWQKEYYDHLIRDTEELHRIRTYIRNNPQKAGIHVPHSSSPQDAGDTVPPASCGPSSPFSAFMRWSDWLYAQTGTTGNLHMVRLAKLLMTYLTQERGLPEKTVAEALWSDYSRGNRPDVPGFLKKFGFEQAQQNQETPPSGLPRQSRHHGNL